METWTSHDFVSLSGWAGLRVGALTYLHVDVYVVQDRVLHTCAVKLSYTYSFHGFHLLSSGLLIMSGILMFLPFSVDFTPNIADMSLTYHFTEPGL